MEIRGWLCYIIINCLLIPCLEAKSVSLNELIAAESKNKQTVEKVPPKLPDLEAYPTSLNKIVSRESQEDTQTEKALRRKFTGLSERLRSFTKRLSKIRKHKLEVLGNSISEDKKGTLVKYKKKYQIKSPLKPKKLKLASRFKRKNQSAKREISGNEGLKHKYIPLLKSVSLLFDELLKSGESDSFEAHTKKYKRNRFYSNEFEDPASSYSSNSRSGITRSISQKKTTTSAPPFPSKTSSDTKDLTVSANNDYSTFRSHKSVPILLPRNTISLRRNHNGTSERSSTTHYRDTKRNITRNNGNYEYHTRNGKNASRTKSNEIDTNSSSRSNSSSIRYSRRDRVGNITIYSEDTKVVKSGTKEVISNDTIGENQLKTRRNKTESENFVREPIGGLRGISPQNKISHDGGLLPEELIRPKEISKESVLSAANNSPSHKRIIDKDGTYTTEDEKIRTRNETVIVIERNHKGNNNSKGLHPSKVLIFDGYSVTRDKNGENKVLGKTIHIRS